MKALLLVSCLLAASLSLAGDMTVEGRFGPDVQLGSVTGSLLMGVLISTAGIDLPASTRTFFFLLFLFATGFAVGPQFFAGLLREKA